MKNSNCRIWNSSSCDAAIIVVLLAIGSCLASCASDLIILLIADGNDFLVSEALDNGARWQSSSNEFWTVSTNIDIPVVAKQSDVGWSNSGSLVTLVLASVTKNVLNISKVVFQLEALSKMYCASSSALACLFPRTKQSMGLACHDLRTVPL